MAFLSIPFDPIDRMELRQTVRIGPKGQARTMSIRSIAALLLACWIGAVAAEDPGLVVSTNNTPMDRKVLEKVSQEAFRRLGMDFRTISLPSERSLVSANQGEFDGEGLRVAGLGSQYPNLVQVQEPYVRISFVAFARDGGIDLSQGWESLKPYRVAFINGWKMFESNASGARSVTKVDTPEQAFRMLAAGRIDLALYTKADGMALLRGMGLPEIAPLTPSLKDVDMFLYLHRKHESLVPRLAQVLRDMKADGSYDRIRHSIGTP
jgi:polar amino acid transport system substrate-binding protein